MFFVPSATADIETEGEFFMGAGATVAAGPPSELNCAEGISVCWAAKGETSAAVSPGGPPAAAVGSTPFRQEDLQKEPANPQEGSY